ncbi:radical SAM protein [Halovenus sp. WSH3]|uniref:Radical SAM protein n=1 Tax=Halovenus carboxidivorans TaxID=2692199 RepID=A0A6B0T338_9EURY|nr:radical SAM protein [Halovenus carboxidivorans]MXR51537.1 radical SAM protein [Halovenus carboxidivorans]
MSQRDHLADTTTLCPECLERIPGTYEAEDGSVYLSRSCPTHGDTDRKVWDSVDHWEWARTFEPEAPFDPEGEFTVAGHHACLAVVEVTQDCNLSCSYCFASSGPGGEQKPYGDVLDLLETVREESGPVPIQLSGGEPTVRDDLPEIVAEAAEMGFEHIQVNTNGLRIAEEDGYADQLADAGATAVYLQFDGLESETYESIREADLAGTKREAVAACDRADLSVVLVPTVVPGVNDHEMGAIVEFALETDIVESVNFQPVAHFGRVAEHGERFSLDEAARRLADQLGDIDPRDLMPVPCCSAYCHTATALARTPSGITAATQFLDDDLYTDVAGSVDESDWLDLVACTPAGKESADEVGGCCSPDLSNLPGEEASTGDSCCGPSSSSPLDSLGLDPSDLLENVLPVSFTGFMDADAADACRLDNCCVSVPTPDGDLVPFCGYNMTTDDGEYALRNREGWGGRPAVGEPVDAEPTTTDDD